MDTEHTIKVMNSLLRGELSAVETYDQAIQKYPDSSAIQLLEDLRTAHMDSVEVLSDLVVEYGGEPSRDSGPWGGFAKSVEAVAAMLGESSAISALKQGEAHGLDEYEEALEDKEVEEEVKEAIRTELLPPLQEHLVALESIQTEEAVG